MKIKERKPWIAAVLTFLCPPLGFVYAGDIRKGIIISILILFFFPALSFFLKMKISIFSLSLLGISSVLFLLFIIVASYRSAKRQQDDYVLKGYNKWWIYLIIYVIYSLVAIPIVQTYTKNTLIQAFKIPAGSMLPTLNIGDHVLVDKTIYKKQKIERLDVIVFPMPDKISTMYLKRVVGLPGDTIEIKDKNLFVNNVEQNETYVSFTDQKTLTKDFGPRDNFGPITVPENSIFVLGDNRDNSFDSRFWGFVPVNSVQGKVNAVYWSWNGEKSRVRWDRIGRMVK